MFGPARLIGGSERATVFQAAYCLPPYVPTVVVEGHMAGAGACPPERASTRGVFADLREELATLFRLVPREELRAMLGTWPGGQETIARLRERLAASWRPRYRKASDAKPRPPRPKRN